METDESRLSAIIGGDAAAEEPDLPSLLSRGMRSRRISLSDDVEEGVDASDFIFISPKSNTMKSEMPSIAPLKDATRRVGACRLRGKTVVKEGSLAWRHR